MIKSKIVYWDNLFEKE